MAEASDIALLREFAGQNSETAFAELVQRHIHLVYSVALRFTGNSGDAEDVTQAVFILLARKAAGLSSRTVLTGWLYETTRFTANRLLRAQIRRQVREREAFMQTNLDKPGDNNLWSQLAPHLEAAMSRLGERDRTLLALRFYENKTGAETATLLGIREDAAHKRTARALEKLRSFFVKRGIASTSAVIAETISANSLQPAPAALAKTVTAAALAKGAAASISTSTLVKGALKIMAWTKAKTAIVATAAVVLAAGTTTVTVEKIHQRDLDAQWDTGHADAQILDRLPHIVRIIPTRFPNGFNMEINKSGSIGFAANVREMLQAVYGGYYDRTIFLTPMPSGEYDFIANLPTGSSEALAKEMQKRFGIIGRVETTETNVLFLKVSQPNTAGLVPSKIRNGPESMRNTGTDILATNMTVVNIAASFARLCKTPVIDQTGLKGTYDFDLKTDTRSDPQLANFKQALRDQLGLELIPGTVPVKYLFVEKAN
jgi:uncharacterized protein (TIGR03435 family)